MKITRHPDAGITFGDSTALDAFGRQRVSDPITLFDYASEYDTGTIFAWNHLAIGTGSVAHDAANSSVTMTTGTTAADQIIRQTKAFFRYQPGKSQLVMLTFTAPPGGNSTFEAGYWDGSDGCYLKRDNTGAISINLAKGGSVTSVAKADWNTNTVPELDLSKASLFWIDAEWLSTGRIRVGWIIEGKWVVAHQFPGTGNNATGANTRTWNLPIRFSLTNVDGGTADSITVTCATVISEGGFEYERGYPTSYAQTGAKAVTTRAPVLMIRPQKTFNSITNRSTITPTRINVFTDAAALIEVVYGPSEWTSASWVAVNSTSSAIERDDDATQISGGHVTESFFVAAAGAGALAGGSGDLGLFSRLPLSLDISGSASTILAVVGTSLAGTANIRAAIDWTEVR